MWCLAHKCVDAHATTLICSLAKYFFSNNKLLRNLEGEGDKGKEDFLHESHIIMEYNIAQGWVWPKNKSWGTYIGLLKSWGMKLN